MVLLIGIVYGVFVSKLYKRKSGMPQVISVSQILTFLENLPFEKKASLACCNAEKECYLFIDDEYEKMVKSPFDKIPTAYVFDRNGELVEKEFYPLANKSGDTKNVYFRFTVKNNGSHSEMIVFYENQYYVFRSLVPVKEFGTMDDAKKNFDSTDLVPQAISDYQ